MQFVCRSRFSGQLPLKRQPFRPNACSSCVFIALSSTNRLYAYLNKFSDEVRHPYLVGASSRKEDWFWNWKSLKLLMQFIHDSVFSGNLHNNYNCMYII